MALFTPEQLGAMKEDDFILLYVAIHKEMKNRGEKAMKRVQEQEKEPIHVCYNMRIETGEHKCLLRLYSDGSVKWIPFLAPVKEKDIGEKKITKVVHCWGFNDLRYADIIMPEFKRFGVCVPVDLKYSPTNKRFNLYVKYTDIRDAQDAIRCLNGTVLKSLPPGNSLSMLLEDYEEN
jgi:hypothetical protein